MARLTMDQISREKNGDTSEGTSLQLTYRALSDVSCLRNLPNLERLDLSSNCLTSLEGLASCVTLKWLSVVENKLESLKGIEALINLTVLNAGKNKLKSMEEVKSTTELRALILNDNNITSICKLDQLKHVNTLVLSRNPITDIGDSLANAKSLTKLSLSNCGIQNIGSSLVSCLQLKELRLSHNNITSIPSELGHNTSIQLLDLGNNFIEIPSDLKVLSAMPNLKNLNLHANPISDKGNLAHKVKKLVPNLRVFNAKPLEQKISRNLLPEIESPKETKSKEKKINIKNKEKNSDTKKREEKPTTKPESKKKEKKRKASGKQEKGEIEKIDDTEVPFEEFVLSGDKHTRDNNDLNAKKKKNEENLVGAFVVDHTKKNKKERGKSVIYGPSDLKFLSQAPDVGAGGPSTWD